MDPQYRSLIKALRAGQKPEFPADSASLEYARHLDAQDKLRFLREEFNIPTKGSLKKRALDRSAPGGTAKCTCTSSTATNGITPSAKVESAASANGVAIEEPSIYFVGNSLGAQPKCIRDHLEAQLETWASIGVNGHFTSLDNSPLAAWQDMAAACAERSLDLVGAASPSEVIYMNTLTVNLHLMMASFYRPTATRHKIIAEWKPFPSDSYAIASQLAWHGLDPSTSLIEAHPDPGSPGGAYIPTQKILALIDAHADSTALVLLPGIQYYTGQLFDVARITAHARARGIPAVGWDLAHAVGNVELALHDWGVDFAVWCTYKYLNAGPGAAAGVFVHERHHHHQQQQRRLGQPGGAGAGESNGVEHNSGGGGGGGGGGSGRGGGGRVDEKLGYRHRLAGWYGADKAVRFNMEKEFRPAEGAAGWQVSNPSAADLASVAGALSVFNKTRMAELRDKALVLTAYLEWLLNGLARDSVAGRAEEPAFKIITPGNPLERGSQLSLLLRSGLLGSVSEALAEDGVVVDVRKPDVVRVAPVPMYCRFEDVWRFVEVFRRAILAAS